jgi:hypothetical protein
MNYYLTSRNIYKCSRCHKQFSVIQGTIFSRSKIPLTKWFLAIYLFTLNKRGISSYQLANSLGVKQHTAWFIMQRLRVALKDENNAILNGIVEGDETFVGPKINRDARLQRKQKKHNEEQDLIHGITESKQRRLRGFPAKNGRKKGSTKEVLEQKKKENELKGKRVAYDKNTIVLGIAEQGGRIVLKRLGTGYASITKDNIYPHLKMHISSDSVFITDEASVYRSVDELFAEHQTINHQETYVKDGVHINTIENVWNHFKRMIDGTYFHLSHYHFDKYLDEYTYRWNRRDESKKSLFNSFVPFICGKSITYKELIRHKMVA